MADQIEEMLKAFKGDLEVMTAEAVVAKHIIMGPSRILDEKGHFELRQEVASFAKVNGNDVVLVGSAKLGFSVSPLKRYKHFGDESDIDVAVVSNDLFDKVWRDVYLYSQRSAPWDEIKEFQKYLFQGWIRPDKLPPAKHFAFRSDWWEFFNRISADGNFGNIKITGGLYKSYDFLQDYHCQAIRACQDEEKTKV